MCSRLGAKGKHFPLVTEFFRSRHSGMAQLDPGPPCKSSICAIPGWQQGCSLRGRGELALNKFLAAAIFFLLMTGRGWAQQGSVAQVADESSLAMPEAPSALLISSAAVLPKLTGLEPPIAAPEPIIAVRQTEFSGPSAREKRIWVALTVSQHAAATFDAWSTRQKVKTGLYRENNPLLRPFAGNASLYAAIQVTPLVLDYMSHRLLHSRGQLRRWWWVPQATQIAASLTFAATNLAK